MRVWGRMVLLAAGLLAASAAAGQGAAPAAAPAVRSQARQQDGFSAQALFDLGNAWLQAGHPGRAILQYERALVLAPQQPALEQALSAARGRAGINVAPPGAWTRTTGFLRDDSWAWCGAVSLYLLCAGLGRLVLGTGAGWTKAMALAGACGTVLVADVIALRWQELDCAVVLQGPTAVRIAPADAAEASFQLHEGELVYLEDRFRDYERVRTDDGRGGWIRDETFAPVRVTIAQAQAEGMPP